MSQAVEDSRSPTPLQLLVGAAAMVIIIAGMKAASSLVVPFLLAVFIAIVGAFPLRLLRRRRLPNWLALLVVIAGLALLGSLVIAVIGDSITDFTRNLPHYQSRLTTQAEAVQTWLDEKGIGLPADYLSEVVDVDATMGLIGSTLSGLGAMLTNSFLVALTVIFILTGATGLRSRLKAAHGRSSANLAQFDFIMKKVQHYMALKTITSFATGLLVALCTWGLGIDFPVLWGLLAFLLNFVPTIGSIIAAIPAILLALIQIGPLSAFLTAVAYIAINSLIGNVIEPKIVGRGLGMSTLAVFLSLVFWGWVLGPAGMFLSVPLTMVVLIGLDANPSTRFWAVLAGSSQSLDEK